MDNKTFYAPNDEHPFCFNEYLCGKDGMGFEFLLPAGVLARDPQVVRHVKSLRNSRDVVSVRFFYAKDFIDGHKIIGLK